METEETAVNGMAVFAGRQLSDGKQQANNYGYAL